MKTSKIFFGLVLLLIFTFVSAIAYSIYQTIPSLSSKISTTLKTGTPSAVPSIKPAETQTPNPNSGVLKPAQTQITTGITIESTDSGKIKGTLNIKNLTERSITEAYLDLYLRSPEILKAEKRGLTTVAVLSQGMLVNFSESKTFNLNAHEKKSLPIEISYSPNLNPGSFKLQSFVITKDGQNYGGADARISLGGNKEFLSLEAATCKLLVSDKEFQPNIGPNVDPGQAPKGRCQFTNPTSKTIKVKTSIDYAIRSVMNYPSSEKLHLRHQETISFAPKETKTVSLTLPAVNTPQVYEAYAYLIDDQDQQISPVIPFRWIIRGSSAYIQEATPDKDFYLKGETAKVSALIGSSMDLFWRSANSPAASPNEGTDLKQAKLTVKILTDKEEVCGSGEKTLPSTDQSGGWGPQNLSVKIERECLNPKVAASILNNDQVLTEYSHQLLTSAKKDQKPGPVKAEGKTDTQQILAVAGFAIAATLVIFILIVKTRKKNSSGPTSTTLTSTILMVLLAVEIASGSLFLNHQLRLKKSDVLAYTTYAPGTTLWRRRSGTNYLSGQYEETVFGDFWLAGSWARQISNDSIEVNFKGNTYNLRCQNFETGFLLTNLINDSNSGLTITAGGVGVSANELEIHTGAESIFDPAPISVTYTVTKTGNLPNPAKLTVNQDFFLLTGMTDPEKVLADTRPNHPGWYGFFFSTDENVLGNEQLQGRQIGEPASTYSLNLGGRTWCGGGTIPGCMGQVEFISSGNITANPDPCNLGAGQSSCQVNVTYTYSAGLTDGAALLCEGNTPRSSLVSGSSYSGNFPAGTYPFFLKTPARDSNNNFTCTGNFTLTTKDVVVNPYGPPPPPTPAPGSPIISSLQIGNGGNPTGGTAAKTSGLTAGDPGLISGQTGNDWFNPMIITLNASAVSPATIKLYATAFYDKNQGQASVQPALTSLSAVEGQIDTDATRTRGFLLAFAAQDCLNQTGNCYIDGKAVSNAGSSLTYFLTGRYYAYVKGSGWVDLSGYPTGYEVYDNSVPAKLLYKAYQLSNGSNFATWQIRLYKAFQSKNMYTPGFVIDSNNLTGFQSDL